MLSRAFFFAGKQQVRLQGIAPRRLGTSPHVIHRTGRTRNEAEPGSQFAA